MILDSRKKSYFKLYSLLLNRSSVITWIQIYLRLNAACLLLETTYTKKQTTKKSTIITWLEYDSYWGDGV